MPALSTAPAAPKPVDVTRQLNPHARIAANASARAGEQVARLSSEVEGLRAQAAKSAALEATVSQFAATQLASLPSDAHRAAVTEAAGADPSAQLRVIAALQKNGILSPTLPTGVTTAPSTMGAPASAPNVQSDADVEAAAKYEQLRKTAPMVAAAFRQQHSAAITRGNAKRASTSPTN
jgi:hypothetical protein